METKGDRIKKVIFTFIKRVFLGFVLTMILMGIVTVVFKFPLENVLIYGGMGLLAIGGMFAIGGMTSSNKYTQDSFRTSNRGARRERDRDELMDSSFMSMIYMATISGLIFLLYYILYYLGYF